MTENVTTLDRTVRPTELRVLHIVSYADATFFREQIDELEARGVTCDVVSGIPSEDRIDWKRITDRLDLSVSDWVTSFQGHNIGYYAYNAATCYPKLLSTSMHHDYDLVHVNSGLMAPFGFLQFEKPIVISFWGSDLLGDYLANLFPHIARLCARYSDANIVMSDEMAAELEGTDCHVIPHGVDLEKFHPIDREQAIKHTDWNENEVNVLFPYSSSREEKNVDLARAVATAVDERLDDTVSFNVISGVPHEEMPAYMNAADVMLLTSDHEGFPNTVKEAMACNLPIVSRDVGDFKDRMRPVEHTYVCNSFEELVDRTEAVLRVNERSNGRRHIRDLGKERMGEQLLDVYDTVISEHYRHRSDGK